MSIEKHVAYHLNTLSGNLLYSTEQIFNWEYLRYFKNSVRASAEIRLAYLKIWGEGDFFTFFFTKRLLMIFSTTGPSASADSYIINSIQELWECTFVKDFFYQKNLKIFFCNRSLTRRGYFPPSMRTLRIQRDLIPQ